jgi:hypothetical protein
LESITRKIKEIFLRLIQSQNGSIQKLKKRRQVIERRNRFDWVSTTRFKLVWKGWTHSKKICIDYNSEEINTYTKHMYAKLKKANKSRITDGGKKCLRIDWL